MAEPLTVHVLEPGGEPAWQAFLNTSSSATLFHDLGFLAYHPPGRFRFHHLVVRSDSRIVALVPGGLVEAAGGIVWRSPVGASIGGPALAPRQRLGEVLAVVEAVQQHARTQGWAGIEMTLAPVVYHPRLGDLTGFALFRHGFRERHRWLCPMIDLSTVPAGTSSAETLFEKRQVQALCAAVRRGAVAIEAGAEGLEDFGRVFEETYARHGAHPTHTLDEIDTLLRRFPGRIRLVLARQDTHVTAGLLVMQLTPAVAATVYICSSAERIKGSGAIVAIAGLIDSLRQRGCRWLDLGPSASDNTLNSGVMFFKEGLGGVGYCRSQWSWIPSA